MTEHDTTASDILAVAKAVTSGVAREERLLTRRDNAEDRGNTERAEELQEQIDAICNNRWDLYEEAVRLHLILPDAFEDTLITKCAEIADMSVYAVHRKYGVVRA